MFDLEGYAVVVILLGLIEDIEHENDTRASRLFYIHYQSGQDISWNSHRQWA